MIISAKDVETLAIKQAEDDGTRWSRLSDARKLERLDLARSDMFAGRVHLLNPGHHPGTVYECPACEARCHCTENSSECVFYGTHKF